MASLARTQTTFSTPTPDEADRAVTWVNSDTGTSRGDIEHNGFGYGMHVVDPNGLVSFADPVTGAVNLFGSDCLLAGYAIIP